MVGVLFVSSGTVNTKCVGRNIPQREPSMTYRKTVEMRPRITVPIPVRKVCEKRAWQWKGAYKRKGRSRQRE